MTTQLIKHSTTMEIIIRIVLSPLIFVYNVFWLLVFSTILPIITCLTILSVLLMVTWPIIWLLKKSGSNLTHIKPFWKNYFLDATMSIWGAFYLTFQYIKTGELFTDGW